MSDFITQLTKEANALLAAVDTSPVAALFDGTASRDLYVAFLLETYHTVKPTSANLTLAGELLNKTRRGGWLADLFVEKAKEEKGHEKLALADLIALGLSEQEVVASTPSIAAQAYNAYSRYIATSPYPVGYLGPAYVMETLACQRGPKAASNMNQSSKVTNISKASVFLGYGDADVSHVAHIDDVLGRIDDPAEQNAVLVSAASIRLIYEGMCAHLPELARQRRMVA